MLPNILDYTKASGLVQCQNPREAKNNSERLYINEAKKLNIDAVLFRRFYKNNSTIPHYSEPAVCIFQRADNFFNTQDHIKLHAELWSAGKNEIYIIVSNKNIQIINARKPAEVIDNKLSLKNLILASEAIAQFKDQRFSSYLFGSGTFWDQTEFEANLNEKNSPYRHLLAYLAVVRTNLIISKSINLDSETIDKLLIVCILIKFLEEIKDDNNKHTLKSIYNRYKINTFAEALEKGLCVNIFSELSNEFNGAIFDKFSEKEKISIDKTDLKFLASFLRADADIVTGQLFLWEQFSFEYLPAEVISSIYEIFIKSELNNEKGVVYTPIHLVNFLVDELMPLNDHKRFSNNSFKVLDPACGSGVFLVAAYKRLLQWWAINNSSKDNIQYPSKDIALKILEDNIFGVDVKETATLITIFGLTTALLDKLSPKEIWNHLKFKDLSKNNINHDSFFKWALKAKRENITFDLAIGNPPFNVESGNKKSDVLSPEFIAKLDFKHKHLPANNFALHFFEGSMILADRCCLILPSNILLYNKAAQEYRSLIFTDFTIQKIFDFTHLRRKLFHKTADTPIVALIAERKPSDMDPIEHVVIKRMVSSERNIRFEIDHYDEHLIPWNWVIDSTKQFIWKTNLLGGGRLFKLIYRLSLLETLGTFIDKKKRDNNWKFKIGYIIGNDKQTKKADYITNQDCIVEFDNFGKIKTEIEQSKHFESTPEEELFIPPYLLIKDVIGEACIPVCYIEKYNKKYLVFKRIYTGISVPISDKDELKKIYHFIKYKYAKLYKFFILAQSASALVKQESYINKEDIEFLPFPENEEYLKLSLEEEIIKDDILNYYVHLGKAIGNNAAGKILHKKVTEEQLRGFGKVFCDSLNVIYEQHLKNFVAKWQYGSIYQTETFTIYEFKYGPSNNKSYYSFNNIKKENLNDYLNNLIFNSKDKTSTTYIRVAKYYEHTNGYDCVFFVKPNATYYWLKSIALRDSDETLMDLNKAGF